MAERNKVAVIGAGGIGGYVAAQLVDAGHDVTLCVRTRFDDLVITDEGVTRTVPVRIENDPARVGPVRWILLTTKSGDTESAAPWVRALSGPDTTLVVIQNGTGQEERGQAIAAGLPVLPAVIYCAVERTELGRITHHRGARIIVPETGEGSAAFAALFEGSTFRVEQSPDFTTAAWKKLFANLVGNSITALTIRRSDVLHVPAIQELGRAVLAEALAIARAEGANCEGEDADKILAMIGGGPASGSATSMYYDRLAGRPLEHRYLTGALVEAADRHGIPVPVNRTLLALLEAVSGQDLKQVA